jgi:hypothetical protein
MHTLWLEVCDRMATVGLMHLKRRFSLRSTLLPSQLWMQGWVPCCPQVRTLITYDSGNILSLVGIFKDSDSGENLENLENLGMASVEIECEFLCYSAPNACEHKFTSMTQTLSRPLPISEVLSFLIGLNRSVRFLATIFSLCLSMRCSIKNKMLT